MKYFATALGREFEFRFEPRDGKLLARCGERTYEVDLSPTGDGTAFSLLVDGKSHDLLVEPSNGAVMVQTRGERVKVVVEDERERAAHAVAGAKASGKRSITAVMPGIVVDVRCKEGDQVEDGQTLVVLEAMKMQNPIAAEGAGKVTSVKVKKGEAVANGALLVEIE